MRTAAIIILIISLLVVACSAQSTSHFQSVSGEFAKNWISSFKAQNPQPVKPVQKDANGSDLWNWGSAPRGSAIVDGKLVTDPYYLRPWLNLSSDWMAETYTDPHTGQPVNTYLDPLTGKRIYVYLNPNTGDPYYSYQDPKTGKPIYAYLDPITGKPVYSSVSPVGTDSQQSSGWTTLPVLSSDEPWE